MRRHIGFVLPSTGCCRDFAFRICNSTGGVLVAMTLECMVHFAGSRSILIHSHAFPLFYLVKLLSSGSKQIFVASPKLFSSLSLCSVQCLSHENL